MRRCATTARNPRELAERTATDERYAREWLEHQAVGGFVLRRRPLRAARGRRRGAARPHQPLLGRPVRADGRRHDRAGPARDRGVPHRRRRRVRPLHQRGAWARRTRTGRCSSTTSARPGSRRFPEVDLRSASTAAAWPTSPAGPAGRRSRSRAPTRRCASTASTSTPSRSTRAEQNLRGSGVESRVRFHSENGAAADSPEGHDLVTIFEALHDMANPVEVLANARELLAPDGVVLVMDEKAAHEFHAREPTSSSTTGSACCSACRSRSPRIPRRPPARRCGRTRCRATPTRRATRSSRSPIENDLFPAMQPSGRRRRQPRRDRCRAWVGVRRVTSTVLADEAPGRCRGSTRLDSQVDDRRSLAVSAPTPEVGGGRAPVACSSPRACSASGSAPSTLASRARGAAARGRRSGGGRGAARRPGRRAPWPARAWPWCRRAPRPPRPARPSRPRASRRPERAGRGRACRAPIPRISTSSLAAATASPLRPSRSSAMAFSERHGCRSGWGRCVEARAQFLCARQRLVVAALRQQQPGARDRPPRGLDRGGHGVEHAAAVERGLRALEVAALGQRLGQVGRHAAGRARGPTSRPRRSSSEGTRPYRARRGAAP